jgi:hypothetical protein
VGEAEELRDPVCVQEILNVYLPTHRSQITAVLGSIRAIR